MSARHHSPLGDAALVTAQIGIARKLARRYVQWGLSAEDAALRSAYAVMLVSATGMGIIVAVLIVLPMTFVVLTDPGHGGWVLLPAKLGWLAWTWLTFWGWILGAYGYVYRPPGSGPAVLRLLSKPPTFFALFVLAIPSHVAILVVYRWLAHTVGTL